MTDAERLQWQDRASCLGYDPEIFFPGKGGSTVEAKAVCGECPVRAECLEYALGLTLTETDYGVWGGTSNRERRRIRKGMPKAAQKPHGDGTAAKVAVLAGKGLTARQIATAVHRTPDTVRHHLKQLGLFAAPDQVGGDRRSKAS